MFSLGGSQVLGKWSMIHVCLHRVINRYIGASSLSGQCSHYHPLRALYNGPISRAGGTQCRRNYTEIRKENRAQWLGLNWGLSPSSAFLPQCHSVSGTPPMEITEQKSLKFWVLGTRLGIECEGLYSIYLGAAASVLTTMWVASPPSIKVIIVVVTIIIMSTRNLHCVSLSHIGPDGSSFSLCATGCSSI